MEEATKQSDLSRSDSIGFCFVWQIFTGGTANCVLLGLDFRHSYIYGKRKASNAADCETLFPHWARQRENILDIIWKR